MAGRNVKGVNGDPEAPVTPAPDLVSAPDLVPAPVQSETVGGQLRHAREQKALSLDAVSERTKVRPAILAAIEADDHLSLPALTYTLGFVKAYARTVGLDPQAMAERYRLESNKGDPVSTMVDLEPLEAQRLPSRGLVMGLSTLFILVFGLLAAWGAGWLTPAPPAEPGAAAVQSAPVPSVPAAVPADPVATANAPVRLTAIDEVWLRITDDSARETLFMGTMTKGQVLDLPPGRPWQLNTGRAGALEVRIGARLLPPLGGPAEQVRGVLLTPEALADREKMAAATSAVPAGR